MKYVMFRMWVGGIEREFPIIFPKEVVHAIVAESFPAIFAANFPAKDIKAVSAGEVFVCAEVPGDPTNNRSTSTGLAIRESDEKQINIIDYTHGLKL
jgi:hypothetical protein